MMPDELERLFRAVFSEIGDAVVVVDLERRIFKVNSAFESLFDCREPDLLGRSVDCLLAGDALAEDRTAAPAETPTLAGRCRCRRRDGATFPAEVSEAPLLGEDGGPLGYFAIIRPASDHACPDHDPGAHQDGGRSSADHETHLRRLDEGTPAMVHAVDRSGRLISVSDAWLTRFGYRRDEVIGRPSVDFMTEESRRDAAERDRPDRLGPGSCEDITCQFVTKKGEVRDIRLSATAERDERGDIVRTRAVMVDVTDARSVERQLAEKTLALEKSNQDLARFAYIASHDLQEPLRRVVTYCQILIEDFGTEVSEEAAEVIEVIQSGGKRMRMMINDLLAYSRLNQQLEKAFEPVDMTAILDQAIDQLASRLEAIGGARIDAVQLPLVWGRASLLQLVCYHLLDNAVKYAGDAPPRIAISLEDLDTTWRFAFADHGIGIEPRFADRIFEIFQRLHRKDDYEGSGAGLAMCKLIVERHGGAIWLDRDYHDGARIFFTLPKDRQSGALAPAQPGAGPV